MVGHSFGHWTQLGDVGLEFFGLVALDVECK